MRTTVIIEDTLWPKLKAVTVKRRLSEFINRCLRDYFTQHERASRMAQLEKAYHRVAKADRGADLDILDQEDWPEW